MKIYQPLKPFIIIQRFGENKACINSDFQTTGNIKIIGCDGNNPPEGYRSVYGSKGHTGLDLVAYHGQEVYCVLDGIVDFIDANPKSGLDVRIVSEVSGKKYRHVYEHLLGYQPQKGVKISTGQIVGWADNTGYSSGDHLHFQLEEWLNEVWVPVNPEPFIANIFAKDILSLENSLKYVSEQVALLMDRVASFLRDRSFK